MLPSSGDLPHSTVTPRVGSLPLAHTSPLSRSVTFDMSHENVPVSVLPLLLTFVTVDPLRDNTILAPSPSPCPWLSISGTDSIYRSDSLLPTYPPMPHPAGGLSSHPHVFSAPPVR